MNLYDVSLNTHGAGVFLIVVMFYLGFCVLVYNRVGVTGTGWQCLATAGISAEGKRTFR